MTVGLYSIGTVTDVMDAGFSGFDYPNTAQVTQLLSASSSEGNAVMQDGGLGFRQGTFECYAEDDDALTLRGYYESRVEVAFVEIDATTSYVRILEFARDLVFGGLWHCTMTLVQSPGAAGS